MRVTEEQYAARFPLDTPGRMYDNIAGRIRAGETEKDVLHDFGMFTQDECKDMTDRITQAQLRAAGGLAGLHQIARAEAEEGASERLAADASPATKTRQKPLNGENEPIASRRFVIGIDPGLKTGFAVWDRERKSLTTVETTTFWELFLGIQRSALYNVSNTCLVIEIAHYAPTFRERRGKATSAGTADRMSRNVGSVTREAELLVEGFRALGYDVFERRPIGKAKKDGKYDAEEDRRQFEQLTGWTERTSQHARDAGRLVYLM